MKIRFTCMLLAMVMLALTGCTPAVPAATAKLSAHSPTPIPIPRQQFSINDVLADANARHQSINAPDGDITQYRTPFQDFDREADDALFESLGITPIFYGQQQPPQNPEITTAQATQEVAWLFLVLRYNYGLYQYFGGQPAFGAAQQAIVTELETQTSWKASLYHLVVAKHLDFIKDTHFLIGSTRFIDDIILYACTKVDFGRDAQGFFNLQDERRVKTIDGLSPKEVLKLCIDQEGWLVYRAYRQAPDRPKGEIVYENGDREALGFDRASEITTGFADIYQAGTLGSTPWVRFTQMPVEGRGMDNERTAILQSVHAIRSHPLAIIDLRTNSGGDAFLLHQWFNRYTGQPLQNNYQTLMLRRFNYIGISDELIAAHNDTFLATGYTDVDPSYMQTQPEDQFLPSDCTRIVRIGKTTFSAGEGLVDALTNVENTLIIGANTAGAFSGTNLITYQLPYSGLPLSFGQHLFHWNADYFREGYGLAPDIYLTGTNTDKRLELFIQRYLIP